MLRRRAGCSRTGLTLIEIMIGFCLFLLLLLAVYRLFFAEVRSIRVALEHIGVNENARLFLSQFANDVRNSNRVVFPSPVVREAVSKLISTGEGKICTFESQMLDFEVKPPDEEFLKLTTIDWRLVKAKDGTFDLVRDIRSDVPTKPGGPAPWKATRTVCGGVKDMIVYTEIRRPVRFGSVPGLPLKSFLVTEPYETDGTGPYLVHVQISFVKQGGSAMDNRKTSVFQFRSCFSMRGRPNGVIP
ncbi:MAG TPA: hypothetical protein VIV61_10840 [Candidatus Ozemobacteraceae bacterium]